MSNPTEVVPPVAAPSERGGLREVGQLAYPVILSQISATVMGIIDSAMVGRIGATELGAVGFAGVWTWTAFALFNGTASGVQTFVSQDHGAGRERRCGVWAWQASFVIVPVVALAALLVSSFTGPILQLLGPSAELQTAASAYLRPRVVGMTGLGLAFVWMSFFRGVGDTRTPLVATVLANVVNAVLDYGLIFGQLGLPELGVRGAGIATAIGEWIYGLFLLTAALLPSMRRTFGTAFARPDTLMVRRFLRTGAPIGGQWVLEMLAFAFFTTLVAHMGDVAMAASQSFLMLLSMSFMQAVGISVAASTLVGRYVGAGDRDAVNRAFDSSLRFAALLAATIAVIFLTVPEAMMHIFTDDPEVIALGAPLVRLGALFQLLDAVAIVSSGALRGAGDTRWPFLVQSVTAWTIFLPLGWFLGVYLEGGLFAAWIGGMAHVAVLGVLLLRRFRSGAWERIEI